MIVSFSKKTVIKVIMYNDSFIAATGRLLMFLFLFFALFMVFFYTCNLRAVLIKQEYEPRIKSLEDVIERRQTPYIADTRIAA